MKKFQCIVLAALLLFSLAWLFFSARFALRAGWDSDVMRQWTVSQYLQAHINPWRVGMETLEHNYGPASGPNRFRLKDLVIYEVHPSLDTTGIEGILPEIGPPTATYPPSSIVPIWLAIGWLPAHSVLPLWLAVNLLALGTLFCLWHDYLGTLGQDTPVPEQRSGIAAPPGVWALAFLLLWPPVHEVFRTSQFVFIVLCFLALFLRHVETRPWLAGVFLSLALIKPSLCLPFLFIPLVRFQWRVFLVVGLLHGTAWLFTSWWVAAPPWVLLKQWTTIPRYMLQGAYTLQEYINRLGLDNTTLGMVLTLGFVAVCAGLALYYRRASVPALAGLCALCALLWTYHERYDYVMILFAACLVWPWQRQPRKWIAVAALVLLGVALSDQVYLHDLAFLRSLRWGGRLAMLALFGLSILELDRSSATRGNQRAV